MEFVVNKLVEVRVQVLLRLLRFYPVSVIIPKHRTHIFVSPTLYNLDN